MLANETEDRTGKVNLVGREIGDNRTVQIHCSIDHADKDLLPGMYLSAVVETGSHPVISLPTEAVVDHQGDKYIFVSSGEHRHEHEETEHGEEGHNHSEGDEHLFEMLPVNVGNSAAGFTELIDADSITNLQIVVKGAYALLSKMKNSEDEGGHHH
jgi:cobalt-zinc-cadmium efflux system membrane fusion protein